MLVVKLLLLSQVFVLGRLKTHGDELCAGQHLAASLENLMLFRLLLVGKRWCAVSYGEVALAREDDDAGPVIQ